MLTRRVVQGSIAGDAPCKGVVAAGQCRGGACGLCYGDGANQTLTGAHAWFIKTISPLYSYRPRSRISLFGHHY